MGYEVPHFINGKRIKGKGRTLTIYNPALGEAAGSTYAANQPDVEEAVNSAKKAYVTWSQTPPLKRSKILFKFKNLLNENLEILARLITKEHGKTIEEAKGSIQRGIDVVDFLCNIPALLKSEFAGSVANGIDCYSIRQPLGVCAGITPFNFPSMIPLWMFPTAIACGNTFILKPSEKDPSCPLALAELAKEAGVPDGVVNVLQGDHETVDAILKHPDIKAISFVGSSKVAQHVYETGAKYHKRIQAFGGAKNHCVIMPDADIEQAAAAIVPSAYGSAGERCMAISVVVAVGDKTADRLIEKMKPLIKNLRIGPGDGNSIDLGPLVTKEHKARVLSYIELGQKEGATLAVTGSQFENEAGYFLGAYLFDLVEPTMKIYQDEIFGPVLCIVRVHDFEQALKLINDHPYGNGTAIFTADGYTAKKFANEVEAGMVGINIPIPVPVAYQSFGGWKQSVFADIGMYGMEGIRFYTKIKTVTERWFPRKE